MRTEATSKGKIKLYQKKTKEWVSIVGGGSENGI
jgi:hypothetical protein